MKELFVRIQFAKVDTAASGANEIIPAITGRSIRVMNYQLQAAGSVAVTWKSGTTALTGAMSLGTAGGVNVASPLGLLQTNTGEALNLTLGGAVQVSGHVGYIVVD